MTVHKFEISFDEFFHLGMLAIFQKLNFDVHARVMDLQKKNLLVLEKKVFTENQSTDQGLPKFFIRLKYFQSYNLIWYFAPNKKVTEKEIEYAANHFKEFLGREKKASFENATASIFCNHRPEKFLTENKKYITQCENGKWVYQKESLRLHILNLAEIPPYGIESLILKIFSSNNMVRECVLANEFFKIFFASLGTEKNQWALETIPKLTEEHKEIMHRIRQLILLRAAKTDTEFLKIFSLDAQVIHNEIKKLLHPFYEHRMQKKPMYELEFIGK